MQFDSKDVRALENMLATCKEKFGEIENVECVVNSNRCTGCTGGCEGHGASIWAKPEM